MSLDCLGTFVLVTVSLLAHGVFLRISIISRYTGLLLWAIYNLSVALILLNLLIALMNATMSTIQVRSFSSAVSSSFRL